MVEKLPESAGSRISRRQLLRYGVGVAGTAASGLFASRTVEGTSRQAVTVDLSTSVGKPDHTASGFLYGLSYDGDRPSDRWLVPLKPGLFVGGGARVEGGAWAKGGREGYEKRWEMVEQQYERVAALPGDAEYVIRISDLWGADAVTVVDEDDPFPGDEGDWDGWEALLERITADVKRSGMDPAKIQFEMWNEPNYSLFWNRSRAQYRTLWRRGTRKLRALYPAARIVGPNFTHLRPDLADRFEDWLEMTISSETVPDIINWHDLQEWNDPVNDAKTVRNILSKKGLSELPLEINEYLPRNQLNAGYNAWDMARIEKSDVKYSALGVWTACCESPELVGLLSRTDDGLEPSGRWWVYKRYASITSELMETTRSENVDAIAGMHSAPNDREYVRVVLGTNGYTGDVVLILKRLHEIIVARGSRIRIVVERIPSRSVVDSPEVIQNHTVGVPTKREQHTLTIPWKKATDAYAVTLVSPKTPAR